MAPDRCDLPFWCAIALREQRDRAPEAVMGIGIGIGRAAEVLR